MEDMPIEFERRAMMLSDADIHAIAAAIVKIHECDCPVTKEELSEAVKFYKNLNEFFDGTKKTVWNTLIVLLIGSIIGLISIGIWHKSGGN